MWCIVTPCCITTQTVLKTTTLLCKCCDCTFVWALARGWCAHSSGRNGSTGASLGIVSKLCFHGWRAYCQAGTIESTFLRLEAWPLLGGYPVRCERVGLRSLVHGCPSSLLASPPKHRASELLALSTTREWSQPLTSKCIQIVFKSQQTSVISSAFFMICI